MCRVLGYLGRPISLEGVLFETDSSLARQTYSPRMMQSFLNLAGFGLAAWEPGSERPQEPLVYRVTTLPSFDPNLRSLARKLAPTCLIAHVRGVSWSPHEVVGNQNVHPFRFPGSRVTLAHNGHLRDFNRMRYELVSDVKPELIEHIGGTTDSEWIYALLMSQLEEPFGDPGLDEVAAAIRATLSRLRDVRARLGIATSSPVNLVVATGRRLVATRFSFDYGWYPDDDPILEVDLPYVSLWFAMGSAYVERDGEWYMVGDGDGGTPSSFLVASEPLTADTSGWLEAPEYSMLAVEMDSDDRIRVETVDLDV